MAVAWWTMPIAWAFGTLRKNLPKPSNCKCIHIYLGLELIQLISFPIQTHSYIMRLPGFILSNLAY